MVERGAGDAATSWEGDQDMDEAWSNLDGLSRRTLIGVAFGLLALLALGDSGGVIGVVIFFAVLLFWPDGWLGAPAADDAPAAPRSKPAAAPKASAAPKPQAKAPAAPKAAAPAKSKTAAKPKPAKDEPALIAAPTEKAPMRLTAPVGGKPDDLKLLKGVGPKLETILHGMGFYHFDQIAAWTPDQVAWVDETLEGVNRGRASRDGWVEQAKILATGALTDFAKRVESGEVPTSQ